MYRSFSEKDVSAVASRTRQQTPTKTVLEIMSGTHHELVLTELPISQLLSLLAPQTDFILLSQSGTIEPGEQGGGVFLSLPQVLRKRIQGFHLAGFWLMNPGAADLIACGTHNTLASSVQYSWLFIKCHHAITRKQWLRAASHLAKLAGLSEFVIRLEQHVTLRHIDGSVVRKLRDNHSVEVAWRNQTHGCLQEEYRRGSPVLTDCWLVSGGTESAIHWLSSLGAYSSLDEGLRSPEKKFEPEICRLAEGGLSVSIHRERSGVHQWCYSAGTTLQRLLTDLGDCELLIITSFRGDRSLSENASLFEGVPIELRKRFPEQHVSAYWLVAHWSVCDGTNSSASDYLEYTWLFSRHRKEDDPKEQLVQAAVELCVVYGQTAFIALRGPASALHRNDGSIESFLFSEDDVMDTWKNQTKLRMEMGNGDNDAPSTASRGSSYRIVGNGTAHEFETYVVEPGNISGMMMFSHRQISYKLPAASRRLRLAVAPEPRAD